MITDTDQTILDNTRHWLEQAVIGLNLCPFAKAPYRKDLVRMVVSHACHIDAFLERLDLELQILLDMPAETVETTLLIESSLFGDFVTFNDMLDLADQALIDNHAEGIVQIASFHPHFCFADAADNDITNYTNRSPYPTLHLIRETSIDKAVAAIPNAADIFERNKTLLHTMGIEGWQALGITYPPSSDTHS